MAFFISIKRLRFLGLMLGLIFISQYLSLYIQGEFLNATAFEHAGLIGLVLNFENIFVFLCMLFILFITSKIFKHASTTHLILIVLYAVLNNNLEFFKEKRLENPLGRRPVFLALFDVVPKKFEVTSLTKEENELAKKIFYKPNYNSHFETKKMNFIVIFAESLNARFLNAYSDRFKNLTPNIANFSKNSLVFTNYYNHTFPTILGVRGTLCSSFPKYSHTDWDHAKSSLASEQKHCLPKILNENKIETTYLGYSHEKETFFKSQMEEIGFKNTYFYNHFLKTWTNETKPKLKTKGNSDFQMFKGLKNFLISHQNSSIPFFVSMSTIGTHPWLDSDEPDEDKYSKNISLNTIHYFDKVFGEFYYWFKDSEYSKNTILILTADHAHAATQSYKELEPSYMMPFDPITLIISSPIANKENVLSSSLDLAPTILELLSLNPSPDFLGLSLLGERQLYPMAVGVYELNHVHYKQGQEDIKAILDLTHPLVRVLRYKSL